MGRVWLQWTVGLSHFPPYYGSTRTTSLITVLVVIYTRAAVPLDLDRFGLVLYRGLLVGTGMWHQTVLSGPVRGLLDACRSFGTYVLTVLVHLECTALCVASN
jgi:hypothetical protein